jgi:hypothetical protein
MGWQLQVSPSLRPVRVRRSCGRSWPARGDRSYRRSGATRDRGQSATGGYARSGPIGDRGLRAIGGQSATGASGRRRVDRRTRSRPPRSDTQTASEVGPSEPSRPAKPRVRPDRAAPCAFLHAPHAETRAAPVRSTERALLQVGRLSGGGCRTRRPCLTRHADRSAEACRATHVGRAKVVTLVKNWRLCRATQVRGQARLPLLAGPARRQLDDHTCPPPARRRRQTPAMPRNDRGGNGQPPSPAPAAGMRPPRQL